MRQKTKIRPPSTQDRRTSHRPIHALKAAIALLIPSQSENSGAGLNFERRTDPRFIEALDPAKFPAEARACRDLAELYLLILDFDGKAPRIGPVLRNFRDVKRLSSELSEALASLSPHENVLLNTIFDVPSNAYSRLGQLYAKLPRFADVDDEGELIPILQALSMFVEIRLHHLTKRLAKAGDRRLDRGGAKNNISRALHGSPEDRLVREGWGLFERMGTVGPTPTDGDSLSIFVSRIHEYATGEPEKAFTRQLHVLSRRLQKANGARRVPPTQV